MAFDRNPRTTPEDQYIAGKTTEAVVRAINASLAHTAGALLDGLEPGFVLAALVARFDRKAAARSDKAA